MELARTINRVFESCDALLTPSAPTFPTIEEVNADPVEANSRLGTYTNFVNLSDCSALALPAGFRADGLPFGITLIGPAWRDTALAYFGKRWTKELALPLGATGVPFPVPAPSIPEPPAVEMVRLAVVGAHLSGMPLNSQLTERNARYVETTTTSAAYQFFALPGTVPPKPGLIRTGHGAPIEVELWDVPAQHFGSFVALIPSPLGIGTLELAGGRLVKGFICEGYAASSAEEITHLGGWRAYIQSRKAASV
jgi:allophanate hydrolase